MHPTNSEISTKKGEVLIRASGVSKRFCRDLKKSMIYGIQDIGYDLMGKDRREKGLRSKEFWANKEISFELHRGECLGLIGRNGAGKTTLLKMLNGLIKPDVGTIEMKGRVGALIALGAGFNPILTGRENVFIAGSVLGLSKKQIVDRYDEIVDFAELTDFMESPVQNYSSGMQVRLGFAVATAMEPDILLIDEVLAVGDAAFRAKCYSRLGKLQDNVATIFVSHSMDQVAQICQKGLFLKQGKAEGVENINEAIGAYDADNTSSGDEHQSFVHLDRPVNSFNIALDRTDITYGDALNLTIELECESSMENCSIRIAFYDLQGRVAAEWNSKRLKRFYDFEKKLNTFSIRISSLKLAAATYKMAFVLNDRTGVHLPVWSFKTHDIIVRGVPGGASSYQLD